jgi:DNA mismatch repair protein MutL
MLSHAAAEACRPYFPRDRFPALFFFLELPPSEVDVNVHPTKREVRFRSPGAIHDLARRALQNALGAAPPVQEVAGPRDAAVSEAVGDYLARTGAEPDRLPFRPSSPAGVREAELPGAAPSLRVVGQLQDTYILVEDGEGLLLVDQHAAHERMLYDRFRAAMRDGAVPVQALLFPVTVEVTPAVAERLEPLLESLAGMGFGVEPFGPRTFLVREVPALMASADPARLLQDLADQEEAPAAGGPTDFAHRVAALSACHAAVRAGMRLEPARMQRVVEDLLAGGYAQTCPHGRPTTLRYPLREIHRAFLRP